jgi:hypothetical protein
MIDPTLHKSLVKEARKQSKKLIDINDKGYNAYRLCLRFYVSHYNDKSFIEYIDDKPVRYIYEHLRWLEKLVFLAPKNVDITLDNILEHCDFENYANHEITPLLGKGYRCIPNYRNWTEYTLIAPPVLEKIESGKLPENIFNYILSHQKQGYENKMMVMLDKIYEGSHFAWEQKAIYKVLKLFGQDPAEVKARNIIGNSLCGRSVAITDEEFEIKFNEAMEMV